MEYFIVDNRESWRKQRYVSFHKLGGNYTWDVLRAEFFTLEQINERYGGVKIYKDRELLFVPCDAIAQLSFQGPAEGDAHPGHGPVVLRHPAVMERLRAASIQPTAPGKG